MRSGFKQNSKTGVAVVEFLFAAPAFFILVFFVIEIALTWGDRHIMRLAAYRAGRVVVKMRQSPSLSSNLCWSLPVVANSPDAQIFKAARRSSAKVMATVTPSVSQLLSIMALPSTNGGPSVNSIGATIENQIGSNLLSEFGDGQATDIKTNSYASAIFRMLKGLPSAWIFTEIECKNILFPGSTGVVQNNGVEIKLTYRRSAKMPYVGTLMYFLKRIQEFAKNNGIALDPSSGIVRVNPLNYGLDVSISPSDPTVAALKERWVANLRADITEKAEELADKTVDKIRESLPENVSVPSDAGDLFGQAIGDIFDREVAPRLKDQFDKVVASNAARLNQIGQAALNIFMQSPDELKTLPTSVSVRIPNLTNVYVNSNGNWSEGSASMVGFFGGSHMDQNMPKLAQKLGAYIDEKVARLPYVK